MLRFLPRQCRYRALKRYGKPLAFLRSCLRVNWFFLQLLSALCSADYCIGSMSVNIGKILFKSGLILAQQVKKVLNYLGAKVFKPLHAFV